MTTPHQILDDMHSLEEQLGDHFGGCFEESLWYQIKESLEQTMHFDFQACRPTQEHIDFGVDLIGQHLFRFPFETVLYSGQAIPKTAFLCTTDEDSSSCFVIVFIPTSMSSKDPTKLMAPTNTLRIYERESELHCDYGALSKAKYRRRSTGQPIETDTHYQDLAEKSFGFIAGATAMLMSSDIETETRAAPAALNKRRARKGKRPIQESRVVRIKLSHRAAHEAALNGHGSPCMHWRRGHFRRIRPDLVVPVAPTIVNANDDVDVSSIAKAYQVRK